MDIFFKNRVNSWLKNRKKKKEKNLKQKIKQKTNIFLLLKCFGIRLFFLTIPKPLKQYTLFLKKNIHSTLCSVK